MFRAWLKKRAKLFDVVVWDGDEVGEANFTNALLTDIPQLMPGVPVVAARIVSEAKSETFTNALKSTGAVPLLIPNAVVDDQNHRPIGLKDWQWRYVRLGAAAMAKVGPGDVIVLGGGDVPLEEIRYCGAQCHEVYSWHCLRVNGLSSICDAYEEAKPHAYDVQGGLRKVDSSGSAHHAQDSLIEHFDVVPFNNTCLDDGRPFGYTFVKKCRAKGADVSRLNPSGAERSAGYRAAKSGATLTIQSCPDDDDSDSYEPLDYSDIFDGHAQQQDFSVGSGSPTTDKIRSKLESRHDCTCLGVDHLRSAEPNARTEHRNVDVARANTETRFPKVVATACCAQDASDDYSCDSEAELSEVPKLPNQAGHGSQAAGQFDDGSYSFSDSSHSDSSDNIGCGRIGDGNDSNVAVADKNGAPHLNAARDFAGHCDDAESVSTYDVSSDCWDSDTPSDMQSEEELTGMPVEESIE